MADTAINPKLRIYNDLYSNEKFTSIDTLSELKVAPEATVLQPYIVQLFQRFGADGNGSPSFPLYLSTMGRGNYELIDSPDLSFKSRVIGRPRRGSYAAGSPYTTGATPGKGKIPFKVYFQDRWFERGWDIESPSKFQATVIAEPVRSSNGYWEYELLPLGGNPASYMPLGDTEPSALWTTFGAHVGLKNSVGNAFKGQSFSEIRNSATHMRWSMNYEGNVTNKAMVFEMMVDGSTFKTYTEWEKYLFELKTMEDVENTLWWDRYNRDALGNILDMDQAANSPKPHASGIDEQIINSRSYSVLTEKILSDTIDDVFYNATLTADGTVDIQLHTGSLGTRLFSEALHNKLTSLGLVTDSNYFIRNTSAGGGQLAETRLEYGAYFTMYKHIDGHRITVVKNPIFDNGSRALKSQRHPDYANLPISSGDMYFLDMSSYEGKPNVVYVAEKGRVSYEKAILGVNSVPGYNSNTVATAKDASSIEFGKTCGVHIQRPTNCFKLLATL